MNGQMSLDRLGAIFVVGFLFLTPRSEAIALDGKALVVERCASCHTSDLAVDACTLCHNYHLGEFVPIYLTLQDK